MTIEQKAKAYDEAIGKLREFYRDYDTVSNLIDVKEELANILPEICESEDERIRKELISFLQLPHPQFVGERKQERWIAWLEKQSKVEEAMREVKEKAEAFTQAHKGETSDEILAQMRGEQKPTKWSEEDENCLSTIIAEFSKCSGKSVSKDEWMRCNDFLHSLRDRYTWKPSEGQVGMLQAIVNEPNNAASESCQIVLKEIIRQMKELME